MSLGIVTFFVLVLALPLALVSRDVMPPPQQMQFALQSLGAKRYQRQVCPCVNADSRLATNEREISNALFNQVQSVVDPRALSSLVPFWGQFIDHDIVMSEQDPQLGNFSLRMSPSDAVLRLTRNVHRVSPANRCRESENFNTPFIDATTIYGDTQQQLALLKEPGACKLTMSVVGDLLTLRPDGREFLSGDPRVTEHSILASLHTLWTREHNRQCDRIASMRPQWTTEQCFWKARQIVIAKIQHITYAEWLPALFGSRVGMLNTVHMKLDTAEIAQAFSVSVYRFGHSMVPNPVGPFTLPSLFFNAQLLIDNGIEPFLQAAYGTAAQKSDIFVVDGLRNFLFAAGPNVVGEDLIARNLFREREVGIGHYNEIRACYGLAVDPTADPLEDSYSGVLREPLLEGASIGETIATVVAEQFRRIREYDVNFYTKNMAQIGSMYLDEIVHCTLASVIRDNTALENVPAHVFYRAQ